MINYRTLVMASLFSLCLSTVGLNALPSRSSSSVAQATSVFLDNLLQEPAVQASIIWSAINVLLNAYNSKPLTSSLRENALKGAAVGSIISLLMGFKRSSQESCTHSMLNTATSTERIRRTALWSVLLYALTTNWGSRNNPDQLYTAAGLTALFSLADCMVNNVYCRTKEALLNRK